MSSADTQCPYWDHVSLNNTKLILKQKPQGQSHSYKSLTVHYSFKSQTSTNIELKQMQQYIIGSITNYHMLTVKVLATIIDALRHFKTG